MELPNSITETPPALRSLHNEVQKLRASLDAERFDKNYLQEELARTNSTLTKVSKERDKYKEEILMLNSRIASDFEENNKMQTQSSGRKQMNAKLKKQLEEMEQRLLDTQLVLEEVQNECDTYKSKVQDLQVERDKWVVFGETESSKVQQLTQHLEKEKLERESLLQLVFELRQYNKQNDSSLRVNVNDQMQLLKETTSKEKIAMETKLLEKTTEIENLKQQLNLEIKEKIKLSENKNNEINKLSIELNELQQKVNDIKLNSKHDLENKMKEIQTLQEEKISLIESFTDKVTKMENTVQEKDLIIQNTKIDLDTELDSKLKLKDEYDKCILGLNQKVSDMDKEILELQNIVLEKTYEVESTVISLQKQTELYQNLESEYSALQADFKGQQLKFQEICHDIKEKSDALENFKENLKKKDHEICLLTENCFGLTKFQEKLLKNIEELNVHKHSLEAELNNTQSMFSDEKNELEMALSQKDAALAILSLDLEQEVKIKKELVKEISQLKNNNHDLSLEIENKEFDLKNINNTLNNKIEELKNVIINNENLEQSLILLNTNKQELIEKLKEKTDELTLCESNFKSIIEQLEKSKTVIQNEYKVVEAQLSEERARIVELIYNLETLQAQMRSFEEKAKTATEEKTMLQTKLLETTSTIENLKDQIDLLIQEKNKLIEQNNFESDKFNKQLSEMEQNMNNILQSSKAEMEYKMKEIQTLHDEKLILIQNHSIQITNMETVVKDKETVIDSIKVDLDSELKSKLRLKEDYEKQIENLNQKLSDTNNENIVLQNVLLEKSDEIINIKMSLQEQMKACQKLEVKYSNCKSQCELQESKLQQICCELKDKSDALRSLDECLNNNKKEISELNKKCAKLTDVETELLKEISELNIQKNSLQEELDNIQVKFHDEKHELEMILSQKDAALAATTFSLEQEINLKEELHEEIIQLKQINFKLSTELEQESKELEHLRCTLSEQVEKFENIICTNENLQQSVTSLNKDKEELIDQLKKKCDEFVLLETDNKNISVQFQNTKAEKEKENALLKQEVQDVKQTYTNVLLEKDKLAKDLLVERNEKRIIQNNMEAEIEKLHSKIIVAKETEGKLHELRDIQSQENNVLKCQIKELEETATKEINTLEAKLLEKNKELENLMCQIQSHIDERVKLTEHNNDEISKLNNQLNDMEQKMNDILQNSACDSENKMREIQTLKEEKNMLIHNFTMEIAKMERAIKDRDITIHNIQVNLDTETNSKLKLREDYDKCVVNLNQKLSNRNNEVVELQTSLLERSDEMESSKISLHKQMKMYHDLEVDYKNLKLRFDSQQSQLEQMYSESEDMSKVIECLNGKLHESEQVISQITNKHSELTEIHSRVLKEIDDVHIKKSSLEVELKNARSECCEEQQELKMVLAQKDSTLAEISLELENEINLKRKLLKRVSQLEDATQKLSSEVEQKNSNLEEVKSMLNDEIKKFEEVTTKNKHLEQSIVSLEDKNMELISKLREKCDEKLLLESNNETIVNQLRNSKEESQKEILLLKQQVVDIKESYTNILTEKECELKQLNEKLAEEKTEKATIQYAEFEIHKLQDELMKSKEEYEVKLQESQINILEETATKEKTVLETILLEKTTELDNLKSQINEKTKLLQDKNAEISKLNSQLNEIELKMNEILQKSSHEVDIKMKEMHTLQEDKLTLVENHIAELAELKSIVKNKDILIQNIEVALDTEINAKYKLKEQYEDQIKVLVEKMSDSNNEVVELRNTLLSRTNEIESTKISLQKQMKVYQHLETEYSTCKLNYEKQQTRLQELCCELETKSKTLECLNEKLHEDEEKIKQLTERCSELSAVQTKLLKEIKLENVTLANKNLEQTIIALKKDKEELMSKLKDKCDELIVFESNKRIVIEQLQQDKTELEKENGMLKQKVEDTRLSYESILTEKDLTLKRLSEELNAEKSGKTVVPKNVEMEIQKLHDEILKSNQETKYKLQEIKGLHSGEYSLLKTVFRELTNLGDASGDSDVDSKRSLNSGSISVDKLEKSSETKEQHLQKCTEKQIALQKERDKLAQLCRSNEADLINVKKFLAELCVYITTFKSVREIYTQKLSKVVSLQRIARRDIHNLEGKLSESIMCKLERRYAAIMQDLAEFIMNMERWTAKSVEAGLTSETIKRAFKSPTPSFCSGSLQNGSMNIQLDELNLAFQKLLEEISLIPSEEMARESRAANMMEIRAEYEDKLNRMKKKMVSITPILFLIVLYQYNDNQVIVALCKLQEIVAKMNDSAKERGMKVNVSKAKVFERGKSVIECYIYIEGESVEQVKEFFTWVVCLQIMKELYQEQIGIFRERQKEEIAILEKELMAAREKLAESSKAYEEHIRGLTTELWSVGEKFLMKKDEADWLRRRQHSGSLMSLQQMHSSGITSASDDRPRASDTHSLRSLQPNRKTDRRGFHMSDEEGEVFDNRCLRELHDTPPANPELRLSELRWRNSLCPPHLKSSYPAETQFAPSLDEDDIKSIPGGGGNRQRKEVGITAYKKPGPPTPSKQAGRLSATDSELRESLRTEAEATARKTSTPSRLRALFRRHDTDNSNTPRNKRLSIFRSKK
ncbi:hypothetical protein EVAR_50936_1 [Eumeta japonica]|uniref:Uncharacterized protein n=1 Tax=Eumeta variegata TaxID=151549 RepID=A0A4C1Y547_EUMVA|nr:hypothetical protein EVAR_50936_1 [Eumeta japonica]